MIKEFQNVIDIFTGADGGVKFCQVRFALEALDAKKDVDPAARELMEIFYKFERLVDVLSKPIKKS